MRYLIYINLLAIVLLAGALGKFYTGAPLDWLLKPEVQQAQMGKAPGTADETPLTRDDVVPLPDDIVPAPAIDEQPPLDEATLAELHLPFPNPARPEAVTAAPRENLLILTEGAYPPFNFKTASGELTGFDVDLAKAICVRLDIDCQIKAAPWSDLIPRLADGKADVVVASLLRPAKARENAQGLKGVIFTEPYYGTPGHFAARRDKVPAAATPEALRGSRVAVQAGSVHMAYLAKQFPDIQRIELGSLKAVEAALASGEADLVFADRNALLRWSLSGKGAECCRLVGSDYTDPAYFGRGAGIALKAENNALRDRMNAVLAGMVADGSYAAISNRYFSQSIY